MGTKNKSKLLNWNIWHIFHTWRALKNLINCFLTNDDTNLLISILIGIKFESSNSKQYFHKIHYFSTRGTTMYNEMLPSIESDMPKKVPYPKRIFLILGTEFCERFMYYGMASKSNATLHLSTPFLSYNLKLTFSFLLSRHRHFDIIFKKQIGLWKQRCNSIISWIHYDGISYGHFW